MVQDPGDLTILDDGIEAGVEAQVCPVLWVTRDPGIKMRSQDDDDDKFSGPDELTLQTVLF